MGIESNNQKSSQEAVLNQAAVWKSSKKTRKNIDERKCQEVMFTVYQKP